MPSTTSSSPTCTPTFYLKALTTDTVFNATYLTPNYYIEPGHSISSRSPFIIDSNGHWATPSDATTVCSGVGLGTQGSIVAYSAFNLAVPGNNNPLSCTIGSDNSFTCSLAGTPVTFSAQSGNPLIWFQNNGLPAHGTYMTLWAEWVTQCSTSSSSTTSSTTAAPTTLTTTTSTTSSSASSTTSSAPYCTPTFQLQMTNSYPSANNSLVGLNYYTILAYTPSQATTYILNSTGLWIATSVYTQTICGFTGGSLGGMIGYTAATLAVQGSYYPPFICAIAPSTNVFTCTFQGNPVTFYFNRGDNEIWYSVNNAMASSVYNGQSYITTLRAIRSDTCLS